MISPPGDSILAPIALFVFKRPEHTLQTLTALATNPEFVHSPLFIYCDGARNINETKDVDLTREIVRNWNHPDKEIILEVKNRGLARSVIAGVTELSERFGHVIVVEDDLIVNKDFLSYLNAALIKYQDTSQVMQISAYMFPIPEFANRKETIFLPNITSWGWATWNRSWRYFDAEVKEWELILRSKELRKRFNVGGAYDYSDMLLRQMNGEIDSWAIRWNWSVFRNSGLVVYPPTSFVRNIGFDGSGTHCRVNDFYSTQISTSSDDLKFSEHIEISNVDLLIVRGALLAMSGSFFVRVLKLIRNNIHRIKMKMFGHVPRE